MINSLKCPFAESAKLQQRLIRCNDLRHCYSELGESKFLLVIDTYCRGNYEECPVYKQHCDETYSEKLQEGIDHKFRPTNIAQISPMDFEQIFPELR